MTGTSTTRTVATPRVVPWTKTPRSPDCVAHRHLLTLPGEARTPVGASFSNAGIAQARSVRRNPSVMAVQFRPPPQPATPTECFAFNCVFATVGSMVSHLGRSVCQKNDPELPHRFNLWRDRAIGCADDVDRPNLEAESQSPFHCARRSPAEDARPVARGGSRRRW